MARYTGARCRKSRYLEADIGLTSRGGRDIDTKCKLTTAPGQHGSKKGRTTDYGMMLRAKQMLRFMYGVLERQFRRYYAEASRIKGATGENLLELLECRLDNVVYRMGFGSTRAEARQLVRHKSIVVKAMKSDGHADAVVVNIPSYAVKPGDIIEVRERSKEQARIKESLRIAEGVGFPEWVEVNVANKSGVFKRKPSRDELPAEIQEQMVVEFYSK